LDFISSCFQILLLLAPKARISDQLEILKSTTPSPGLKRTSPKSQ
jgi:hypothetical protein